MRLEIVRYRELARIFALHSWPMDNDDGSPSLEFERLWELIDNLNDDQAKLVIELLVEYTLVRLDSYIPYMRHIVKNCVADYIVSKRNYYILPMIAPKDRGRAKSGVAMIYHFLHSAWRKSERTKRLLLIDYINPDEFYKQEPVRDDSLIIIVDDFIGTGDTASDFFDDFESKPHSSSEQVIVVCICAMEEGIIKIQQRGYPVCFAIHAKKGIRDSARITNKPFAYRLMSQLEAMLQIASQYNFGYKQSEALVTMERTPDNTFPIFWAGNRVDGTPWPAPFPR